MKAGKGHAPCHAGVGSGWHELFGEVEHEFVTDR